MAETLEKFAATHTLGLTPVMRNPDWVRGTGLMNYWIDAQGEVHSAAGRGHKAVPIEELKLPAETMVVRGGVFGVNYGLPGQVISSEWWLTHYAENRAEKGVMVTREAAAAALRACSWPDSSAPCGVAGNSNDDDATFQGYDEEGNCIVRLFMARKGYFKVKIPRTLFLEIVES